VLLCSWNFTTNAVSVAIWDNDNRLIFEIWWNFFYDLFSIKNIADVNSIDSFVSKRNMEEFSFVIMKTTWWAFLILFLNVAMVIKEFNIQMLKSPLNQERYKILLMIYFLIYRIYANLLHDSSPASVHRSDHTVIDKIGHILVEAVLVQCILHCHRESLLQRESFDFSFTVFILQV
jgi:hypothetical protein